jgi:hypothetical protein
VDEISYFLTFRSDELASTRQRWGEFSDRRRMGLTNKSREMPPLNLRDGPPVCQKLFMRTTTPRQLRAGASHYKSRGNGEKEIG